MGGDVASDTNNDIIYSTAKQEYNEIVESVCKLTRFDFADKFSYSYEDVTDHSIWNNSGDVAVEFLWKSMDVIIRFDGEYLYNFTVHKSVNNYVVFQDNIRYVVKCVINKLIYNNKINSICRLVKK